MVDPPSRGRGDDRLGMKRDADAGGRQHRQIIGAVADRHRLRQARTPCSAASASRVWRLVSPVTIGGAPCRRCALRQIEPIGDDMVEPEFSGDPLGEYREARPRPARSPPRRSASSRSAARAPGVSRMRRPPLRARAPTRPASSPTRASSAAAKSISPFIARRVISATWAGARGNRRARRASRSR